MGVAMKIDEYTPMMSPTSRATPNSCKVVAPKINEPTTRIDSTGSTAVIEVLMERISTSLSERLAISVRNASGGRTP